MARKIGSPTAKAGPERTSIRLEKDVRQRAIQFCSSRGISFEQGLNELVRIGLASQREQPPPKSFQIHPRSIGLKTGFTYDNVGELLEVAEGVDHR
jgi:hypothetical protein